MRAFLRADKSCCSHKRQWKNQGIIPVIEGGKVSSEIHCAPEDRRLRGAAEADEDVGLESSFFSSERCNRFDWITQAFCLVLPKQHMYRYQQKNVADATASDFGIAPMTGMNHTALEVGT